MCCSLINTSCLVIRFVIRGILPVGQYETADGLRRAARVRRRTISVLYFSLKSTSFTGICFSLMYTRFIVICFVIRGIPPVRQCETAEDVQRAARVSRLVLLLFVRVKG